MKSHKFPSIYSKSQDYITILSQRTQVYKSNARKVVQLMAFYIIRAYYRKCSWNLRETQLRCNFRTTSPSYHYKETRTVRMNSKTVCFSESLHPILSRKTSTLFCPKIVVWMTEKALPAEPARVTGFKPSTEEINRVHSTTFALRAQNCTCPIHSTRI